MGAATAQVLLHSVDDLGPGELRVFQKHAVGRHDHSGGAESALQGAVIGGGGFAGEENRVYGDFSTIGGGSNNAVGG